MRVLVWLTAFTLLAFPIGCAGEASSSATPCVQGSPGCSCSQVGECTQDVCADGSCAGSVGNSGGPTAGSGGATGGAHGGGAGTTAAAGTGGSNSAGAAQAGAGGASAGGSGGGGGSTSEEPPPDRAKYLSVLLPLVDALLTTQITDVNSVNFGALVSPSNNPDPNPIHSRAAEAVYPFAVAYEQTGDARYSTAAVALGNWLISIQDAAGFWSEDWPVAGWNGTTADQLISLAGALAILEPELTEGERASWSAAVTASADWIVANFPAGNMNYQPTGAVALVLAEQVVDTPAPEWRPKAESLMQLTVDSINEDNFITGEGDGVDLGYNIAQSIGFIALYGILTGTDAYVAQAADLLATHMIFMYPGGAIDNSWGTRSYKWTLESGTKTAPGIYFTFGLLADREPAFQRGAQLALSWLEGHYLDAEGWVVYGPHAAAHPTSNPPSNYSTFARAQSIATVIEYGPESSALAPIPAESGNFSRYFPSAKVGVVRTEQLMATVTAYKMGRYVASMVGGGSASALWFEGYGPSGFIQVSSQTDYLREELRHMPIEDDPLPLTPRVETAAGTYFTNLYDTEATLMLAEIPGGYAATSSGVLRSVSGTSSGVSFTWGHEFMANAYSKVLTLSDATGIQVVEPFVNNAGNQYAVEGSTFRITTAEGSVWELVVDPTSSAHELVAGEEADRYYSPFPGIECHPLTIRLTGNGAATLKYTVTRAAP